MENLTNKCESNISKLLDENFLLWCEKSWFNENKLENINLHWLQFAPPSKFAHLLLAILYILIMTSGVFGNSLVIFMFMRCRSLRTSANILVTNLAISDLLMMMKMPLFIYNSINDGIPLGKIVCTIYGFIGGLSGTVSISTLSCIALDRYYVVVYPLNLSATTLRSKIFVVVSWLYGIIFAILPIVHSSFGSYVPEGFLTSCSFDYLLDNNTNKYFIFCYFLAAWLLPFLIISICYFKIIRVVVLAKNIGNKMKDSTNSFRHCKEQEQKKKEIRLAFVVLIIIGLWFIAWTPYAVVALLGISGKKELISPLTSMIPALFCKSASCLDPFVYAVTNKKFKDELKLLFRKQRLNQNKKVWSTKKSSQQIFSTQSEDDVEEIMISLESFSVNEQKNNKMARKVIRGDLVQPVEVTRETNLSDMGKRYRASWVFRPNFSNHSSSLRGIARTWNKRKDSSIEENIK